MPFLRQSFQRPSAAVRFGQAQAVAGKRQHAAQVQRVVDRVGEDVRLGVLHIHKDAVQIGGAGHGAEHVRDRCAI